MGLTPLSGIMGQTRVGEIDADVFSILNKNNLSVQKISELLSKKSGFFGLAKTKDTKKIIQKAKEGNEKYKLVYEIYLNQISAQIGEAFLLLQGCDLITLSGGVGFNNKYILDDIYKKIKILGIKKRQLKKVKSEEAKLIFEKIKNLN